MRHFIFLSTVLGGCCITMEALACTPLPQILDSNLLGSPLIKSAQLDIEIADNNLLSVRSNWRPQVSAIARTAAGDTPFSQVQVDNNIGLRLSQRVFDFGRSGLQRKVVGYERTEASARYNATKEKEAFEIINSYVDILEANETLLIMNDRQSYLEEKVDTLSLMLAQGSTTISNISEAKAEFASTAGDISFIEALKSDAESQLLTRNGEFKGVCNLKSVLFWLDAKMIPFTTRQYTMADMAQSPLYQAEDARYQSLKIKESIAKRSRLPIIEAVGTSLYGYDNFNEGWGIRNQIGIEVNLPIVTGGRQKAKLTRTKLDTRRAYFKTREIARLLHQKTLSITAQIKLLSREVEARVEAKTAVLAHYDSAVQEYNLGALTFSELIEIRLKRDNANLKLTKVKFELIRQRLHLTNLTTGFVTTAKSKN